MISSISITYWSIIKKNILLFTYVADISINASRNKSYINYKANKENLQRLQHMYLEEKFCPSLTTYDNTPHFLMELPKMNIQFSKDIALMSVIIFPVFIQSIYKE